MLDFFPNLDKISSPNPSPTPYRSSILPTIKPNTNPTSVAKNNPISPFITPNFMSLLSLMTVEKVAAINGPYDKYRNGLVWIFLLNKNITDHQRRYEHA